MKHSTLVGMACAVPAAALTYWLAFCEPKQAASPGQQESRHHAPSGLGSDPYLRALQSDVRRLERQLQQRLSPETAASDARDEAMADEVPRQQEPEAAPQLSDDEVVQKQLDQLHALMAAEPIDQEAGRGVAQHFSESLRRLGLERLGVSDVSCFETLCRVEVRFGELESRDQDFHAALTTLDMAYYAYVADAESTTGEIYLAREGQDLWASLAPAPGAP